MPEFLDDRTQLLNDADFNKDGKYVVYWMQLYKRSQHNRALNKAIEIANVLGLPVVVYEGLKFYYPWASDRIHSFILEGINEKREAFARLGIRYVFYLQETDKSPKNTVEKIAKHAAALVTEDYPCFIVPGHNGGIAKRLKIPLFTVDDNGLVPMRLLLKEQFAARTIRPRINRLLPDMEDLPQRPALKHPAPDLKVDCPDTIFTDAEIPALLKRCGIDHSVSPVAEVPGGEKAGHARLAHFIKHALPIYEDGRNKPDIDGSSRLSPYLHFGMLSAGEIREAVGKAKAPQGAKDAFLEELIIRRELSFNFCHFNPEYATLDALPDWAKKTMAKHDGDKRAVIYTVEQLEAGETGDTLWNATQHELVNTGRLHNYMRMLWGKKIIEWTPDYETAFNLMEHLNNKYALDGRDPNSYAGILWCFGKHDRAWGPERPIFGTLRYLSSDSWRKKVNAKAYIAKYGGRLRICRFAD